MDLNYLRFTWWYKFKVGRWLKYLVRHPWIFNKLIKTSEFGWAIPYADLEKDKDLVVKTLKKDAKDWLPKGTKYELRIKIPTNFGRDRGIAWYTNGRVTREKFNADYHRNPELDRLGGYFLLERNTT